MRQRVKLKIHTRHAVAKHFASSSPKTVRCTCVSFSHSIANFLILQTKWGQLSAAILTCIVNRQHLWPTTWCGLWENVVLCNSIQSTWTIGQCGYDLTWFAATCLVSANWLLVFQISKFTRTSIPPFHFDHDIRQTSDDNGQSNRY